MDEKISLRTPAMACCSPGKVATVRQSATREMLSARETQPARASQWLSAGYRGTCSGASRKTRLVTEGRLDQPDLSAIIRELLAEAVATRRKRVGGA